MRWCNNCGKANGGWPFRCHYCGVGLEGRLCPRNHVNPVDPGLTFCGECGQPLERKWGAGFSFKPYALAGSIFAVTFFLAGCVALFAKEDLLMSGLIVLVILIVGLRLAFQILPPSIRTFASEAVNLLLRLVLGTGNKG
jgi:hypothetical protein